MAIHDTEYDDLGESPAGPGSELRQQAEAAARAESAPVPGDEGGLTPEATRRLLHELRIHQIELEMQNEELRRAQAELEDSRARYFDLYEMAPVGYLTVSPAGVITEANLTAATIFGVPRSALVAQPVSRFILPDDEDAYYLHRKRVFETGAAQACELRLRNANGDETWVRLVTVGALEADGATVDHMVITSVTERKRAEEALRASEALYRTLVESMSDGVAVKDLDGRFVAVNSVLASRLGAIPEDIVGKLTEEVYPPDRALSIRGSERQVVDSGRLVENEYVTQTADGPCYWEAQRNPIRDAAGKITGVVSVSRDISDRMMWQEKLHQSERLELAGRIAGQVAHDFNNLLSPLMAYPDLIKSQLPPGHPAAAYCDVMVRSAQRAAEISDDLLTLARRGHVAKQVVSLNMLALEAVSAVSPQPPGLRIEHELAPELLPMLGSSAQIGRVISNLVMNAREAMHDEGVLRVSTSNVYTDGSRSVPLGEYVFLSIADTGVGILPEHRELIFEPFFTTRSGERRRGAGLGMSIVRSVVEDHGGHITFDTEVGQGTTFNLYFPVDRSIPVAVDKPDVAKGTERVLVVDDDVVQRDLTDGILSRLGYRVTGSPSGESAVKLLSQTYFDLVILDMVMPGGWDGAETLRRIREIHPQQRTLIASGFAHTDRVKDALALGAGALVRKPLTVAALATAVRAELDRRLETNSVSP